MAEELKKGKTAEGFEYAIMADAADDMEILEGLEAIDDGDPYQISHVLERLLGKDQKKALYDFYREKFGKVRITTMLEVIDHLFDGDEDLKNSESSPVTEE